MFFFFFFSSRRRHTRYWRDWSSDVCSSDLRLVFVGITTQEISFPHPLMHRREMTLLASRNALTGDFSRIIQLIENGQIDTRPWITHRPAFEELIDVFPSYTRPETGVI